MNFMKISCFWHYEICQKLLLSTCVIIFESVLLIEYLIILFHNKIIKNMTPHILQYILSLLSKMSLFDIFWHHPLKNVIQNWHQKNDHFDTHILPIVSIYLFYDVFSWLFDKKTPCKMTLFCHFWHIFLHDFVKMHRR